MNEAPLYRSDEAMVRILAGPSSRVHQTRALERIVGADCPDSRIAQILLENGALPDFERGAGATEPSPSSPLIRAFCAGQLHLVRLLVEYGAIINLLCSSVDIQGISGWFVGGPLQLARELGHQEIAAFLRELGASEDVGKGFWDKFGFSAANQRNRVSQGKCMEAHYENETVSVHPTLGTRKSPVLPASGF